jgi:hypothetical protein
MSLSGPPDLAASLALGSELARLRFDWGHCYIISTEHGAFAAERRDTGAMVRALTADALRKLIQDDHAADPVPKRFRAPEAS